MMELKDIDQLKNNHRNQNVYQKMIQVIKKVIKILKLLH